MVKMKGEGRNTEYIEWEKGGNKVWLDEKKM
jgi:hypothetical protein